MRNQILDELNNPLNQVLNLLLIHANAFWDFLLPSLLSSHRLSNRRSHNETSEKFASFTRENEKSEIVFFFKIRTQKKIDKNLLVEMKKLAFVDAAGWGEIYQSSKFAT